MIARVTEWLNVYQSEIKHLILFAFQQVWTNLIRAEDMDFVKDGLCVPIYGLPVGKLKGESA